MATRREVLQGLIVSLGGAAALTACGGAANVVATRPGAAGRFHSEREMALLARVSELIIPRTETPGALDVNVPGYIDGLMSDWANADTQQRHRQALTALDRDLSQRASADYLTVDANQAEAVLAALDAEAFTGNSGALAGYRRLKGYITQSYFATEGGALEELKWVAVPGRWDPSVEVSEA
ncbi:MAG: hypothetical protein PsegKO_21620 [Pseudohongiellaceae bacterium]|jgi:hypothetical protein